jgi:hypothetical protein
VIGRFRGGVAVKEGGATKMRLSYCIHFSLDVLL